MEIQNAAKAHSEQYHCNCNGTVTSSVISLWHKSCALYPTRCH